MNITYKYLSFKELELKTKTKQFIVQNKLSDFILGHVKWYAPWRKYCFLTYGSIVFDAGCLANIQDFLNKLMAARVHRRQPDAAGVTTTAVDIKVLSDEGGNWTLPHSVDTVKRLALS